MVTSNSRSMVVRSAAIGPSTRSLIPMRPVANDSETGVLQRSWSRVSEAREAASGNEAFQGFVAEIGGRCVVPPDAVAQSIIADHGIFG